jgi:C-terminal processing protease CtpA/Prc
MLTAVAPGSPAARAGLRPGDVVARIDNFEVRGVEDMSWLIRETGFGRQAEFTVHRANESPRSFHVRLSETQNPALETARAETRAAEVELGAAKSVVRRVEEELRRTDAEVASLDESLKKPPAEGRAATPEEEARRAGTVKQLETLRRRLVEIHARLMSAETDFVRSRARLEEATARLHAAGGARLSTAFRPLIPFGVKAMLYMGSVEVAGRHIPDRGLVVLEISPDGPAARAGLRVGDVIETIDGQTPHSLDLSDQPPAVLGRSPALAVRRNGERFVVKLSRPAD